MRREKLMKQILILALLLVGCVKAATTEPERNLYVYQDRAYLYVDPDTGCNYLTKGWYSSLTPRIAADGKTHMGCKGARP
jgi:hypothetical protein